VTLVVIPYSAPFSEPSKDAPIMLLAWDPEERLPDRFVPPRQVAQHRESVAQFRQAVKISA